jgi:hypothetical protein
LSKVITGLFENPSDATAAISMLESKGVPSSDISLIAGENMSQESFAIDSHSKLPEGAAIGAGMGGAIGALVAGFAAVGTIATGGLGLIAAGPVVAALAGAGAGAAAGGVVGLGIGAVIPEHEVKYYEDAFKRGSVLVGVEAKNGDTKDTVKETFEQFNATKVSNA